MNTPPGTALPAPQTHPVQHGPIHSLHKNGREKIGWSEEVWGRIDAAVSEEMSRSRVAAKFLPIVHVRSKDKTAPADVVSQPSPPAGAGAVRPLAAGAANTFQLANAFTVDEGATIRINEFFVEFAMTQRQVEEEAHGEMHEHHHAMHHGNNGNHGHGGHPVHHGVGASTGITLATRAANILAQVEDTVIFQGLNARQTPLFTGNANTTSPVGVLGTLSDLGLLNIDLTNNGVPTLPQDQVIQVKPTGVVNGLPTYQEATVSAVALGYSVLQGKGHYGPYALVLQTIPFADSHSPLRTTLITPSSPIKELVAAGFYGTGTLPPWTAQGGGLPGGIAQPNPPPNPALAVAYTGVMVSLGGNTMDLVRGRMADHMDVITTFEQQDAQGNYRFRIMERLALRLKDPTAVVLLEFLNQ